LLWKAGSFFLSSYVPKIFPPAARDGGSYKEALSLISGPMNFQLERAQAPLVGGFEFLPTGETKRPGLVKRPGRCELFQSAL